MIVVSKDDSKNSASLSVIFDYNLLLLRDYFCFLERKCKIVLSLYHNLVHPPQHFCQDASVLGMLKPLLYWDPFLEYSMLHLITSVYQP